MIIVLFSLGAVVQALRANIDWESPFLKGVGHFGPKFQVQGRRSPPTILRVGKLDELSFHMV